MTGTLAERLALAEGRMLGAAELVESAHAIKLEGVPSLCRETANLLRAAREKLSPTRKPLTRKQAEILDFLEAYQHEHRCSASFTDVARQFGYASLATVHEHLGNLQRKGYIRRDYNVTRGIIIIDPVEG